MRDVWLNYKDSRGGWPATVCVCSRPSSKLRLKLRPYSAGPQPGRPMQIRAGWLPKCLGGRAALMSLSRREKGFWPEALQSGHNVRARLIPKQRGLTSLAFPQSDSAFQKVQHCQCTCDQVRYLKVPASQILGKLSWVLICNQRWGIYLELAPCGYYFDVARYEVSFGHLLAVIWGVIHVQ
jgi:hypothetical protein